MSVQQFGVGRDAGRKPFPDDAAILGGASDAIFGGRNSRQGGLEIETPLPDMQLRWTFTLLHANGQPDPSPPQPNPAPISGTLAPTVVFPAVGARVYRVTFTVTDAGGLSASDSVDVMVTSSVIL